MNMPIVTTVGYDEERVLMGANTLFAAEFLSQCSPNLQDRITSSLCFTNAVENSGELYQNFEYLLKTLDEIFYTQGTLEDFKMANEVHDHIETMFLNDPTRLSGVLHDINNSRQVFARPTLVMPTPAPRPS